MFIRRNSILIIALLGSMCATAVFGQSTAPQTPQVQSNPSPELGSTHADGQKWGHGHHRHSFWAKRIRRMNRIVHATKEQRHQIWAIAKKSQQDFKLEMANIPKEAKLTRQVLWTRHMEQVKAEVRAVLSPEQQAKLDKYLSKHHQHG